MFQYLQRAAPVPRPHRARICTLAKHLHLLFLKENVYLHASGDGAVAGRCCRLCGGDTSLRALGDTYVWEGVEERYDNLLYDCFGIMVSTADCLICEWCVQQLRNTKRFRALVHAAFDKPTSSSIQSRDPAVPEELPNSENVGIIDNKAIIELLNTNMTSDSKKRLRGRVQKPSEIKRANIQCKLCRQKYLMLVTSSGSKEFVCSRCKKDSGKSVCKSGNMRVQAGMVKEHMRLHVKADSRGKIRQASLLKKPSQTKRQESSIPRVRVAKLRCSICQKKFTTSEHLVEHTMLVHGERRKTLCVICGKNFRTKDLLDKHIQTHIDLKHFDKSAHGFTKPKYPSKVYGFAREKRSV